MKDIVCGSAASAALAKDAVYKEVVVVGNGPSGIALSYMLSGNWPYWQAARIGQHPDELLRARLNYAGAERSLVQHDLEQLADGLEGRSTNPVSLLLDSLQNPCADIGMTLPSMLHYRRHEERHIDHVVLGKGPPGGSWHRMDPNLRTLSLSTWMSLPGYDYRQWEEAHPQRQHQPQHHHRECRHCATEQRTAMHQRQPKQHNAATCNNCAGRGQSRRPQLQHQLQPMAETNADWSSSSSSVSSSSSSIELNNNNNNNNVTALPRRNLALLQRQVSKEVQTRALVSRVAEYYESYVQQMQLADNFVNDTVVTSVQPFAGGGSHNRNARWIVQGKRMSGKPFAYVCRNVVLAVGASDLPNRLGLHGESLGHPWIKHELPQLELALERLTQRERSKLKPVLIIGAGLSAADAVTICRTSQVPVIHVYRNSSVGLDKMLPEAVYPEYHAVHKMMKESTVPYDLYTPLAEHTLVSVHHNASAVATAANGDTQSHQVTLLNQKTGETRRFDVSFCAILIGSRPDLRLLKHVHQPRYHPQTTATTTSTGGSTISSAGNGGSPLNRTNSGNLFEHIGVTLKLLDQGEHWLLGRKLNWLKNLCAKCRTMSFCEWSGASTPASTRRQHSDTGDCPMLLLGGTDAQAADHTSTAAAAARLLAVADMGDPSAQLVALQLGEDPLKPIDCKTNPIAVNKYTNEVLRTGRRGMYAMGPLVGDNFVRFIAGGALAITSALHREND